MDCKCQLLENKNQNRIVQALMVLRWRCWRPQAVGKQVSSSPANYEVWSASWHPSMAGWSPAT